MHVALIVPALNEEASIGPVLDAVPREQVQRIIVVDNNSTDQTAAVAQRHGAEVIQEKRQGYGYACFAGAEAAASSDVLIFMDADGADNPREIPRLLAPIENGQADLVIGSRTSGDHEPGALLPHARFGNWLTAMLMRRLYGLQVSDLGPFRAIKQPVFAVLQMQEMTFGWTTEMMVKAARQGYRVTEIPVTYRRRIAGKSKISGTVRGTILAGYFILTTTLKYARKT